MLPARRTVTFIAMMAILTGSGSALAEGSAQLGPHQSLKDYSKANSLRTVEASSLFVDIINPGEVIHISLCGTENSDALSVHIFDPDGTELLDTGVISANLDCDEGVNQPLSETVKLETSKIGAYRLVMENHDALQFERFDISVAKDRDSLPDSAINGGRVWSYSWNLNSDSFSEQRSTDAAFYALMPGGREDSNYIWKLDLNNFAGWEYDIVANNIGVNAPGSGYSTPREGHSVHYQYPLYLGVPAIAQPRPQSAPMLTDVRFIDDESEDFSISPASADGIQDGGFFEFNSDVTGTYALEIDLNRNGIYGDAGDTTLLGNAAPGLNRIAWDGHDSSGSIADAGTYTAVISVRLGEYHFISEDVETSGGGVHAANPADGYGLTIYAVDTDGTESDTRVFWDDKTLLGSGSSNTPEGALSSTPEGKHAWGDFSGEGIGNNSYIDTYVYGLQTKATTQVRIAEAPLTATGHAARLIVDSQVESGKPVNVALTDPDLNGDADVRESTIITASNLATRETEQVLLRETNANSGEFTGYLVTQHGEAGRNNDNVMNLTASESIEFSYYDQLDENGNASIVRALSSALPDTDGDGIADISDSDDDNDGILDLHEGNVDSDGDGILDSLDTDSDNDGISDSQEVQFGEIYVEATGQDQDGDGVDDQFDTDSGGNVLLPQDNNANSISDYLEGDVGNPLSISVDTDGDGIPDYRDEDLDGDGITNSSEGVDTDTDGDGIVNPLDIDSDNDLILDVLETELDVDSDGVANYLDLDSDNDGISDSIESGGVDPSQSSDAHNPDGEVGSNGLLDHWETQPDSGEPDYNGDGAADLPVDTDTDGDADFVDADSDSDQIADAIEGSIDSDNDGIANFRDPDSDDDLLVDALEGETDSDGDTIPDYLDIDSDNDGISDLHETANNADADSSPNYLDVDSDNDGISDFLESGHSIEILSELDKDADSLIDEDVDVAVSGLAEIILESLNGDAWELMLPVDTDNDSIPDFLDRDSDNDSLLDLVEATPVIGGTPFLTNLLESQTQTEQISLMNAPDTDKDSIPDYRDLDSDNDGLSDIRETTGLITPIEGHINPLVDNNADGIDDSINLDSMVVPDIDGDRIFDFRDLDSDQDSLSDLLESQGSDVDGNGLVDQSTDQNTDGMSDQLQEEPAAAPDADQDQLPDYVDRDSDDNGISDLSEAGSPDQGQDGIVDLLVDTNNNGIADSVDASFTGGQDQDSDGIDDEADADITGAADSDTDGIVDIYDADANGDGIVDTALLIAAGTDGSPADLQSSNEEPVLYTGLGGGCTVAPSDRDSVDPILPGMVVLSLFGLFYRRRKTVTRRCAFLPIVSAGAVLFSTQASAMKADWLGEYLEPHVYLGLGVGMSRLNPDDSSVDYSIKDKEDTAYNVVLGLDFFRHLSGELQYNHLGTATLNPQGDVTYKVFGASGLIYSPAVFDKGSHRTGLRAFGRIGTGVLDNASSVNYEKKNGYHLLSGAGLEYGTTGPLALRLEYIRYDRDAHYAGLAVLYRTGTIVESESVIEVDDSYLVSLPVEPELPAVAAKVSDPVPDKADKCTSVPAGEIVNEHGCKPFIAVIKGISFESGSATLTRDAEAILVDLASRLLARPEVRIVVMAHTDSRGEDSFNMELSQRRANSVVGFLVSRGITKNRLEAEAYGETKPIASNATAAGRSANRRVVFRSEF